MEGIKIEIELPKEILNYISLNEITNDKVLKELIIYKLIKDEKISFGKGAEILGMSKIELIEELSEYGVNYFDQPIEEVIEDKNAIDKM
ncbi:hypothetical protein Calkr_2538 [Caldicellulosiruptor acetigenus I77R1B]|jgi:predicted HTH domain antitoxin|uniref:Uncharacterized protein n=2 Tax=Caldicellulosiruptor acetigenus TaxID=301953 RepID=G2PYL1_9FIRM|nr:UPF0175 family protein [Caldicellulosiruptor acetigenus]ADQ41966.1 hypothetical protein Calkr_2538 [Caldicellulosiruptor acetigenus I77R1B]AEM74930.1 hypothetical protein Calla_2403 [Caldicellulosiruptor acetigenus 6A]